MNVVLDVRIAPLGVIEQRSTVQGDRSRTEPIVVVGSKTATFNASTARVRVRAVEVLKSTALFDDFNASFDSSGKRFVATVHDQQLVSTRAAGALNESTTARQTVDVNVVVVIPELECAVVFEVGAVVDPADRVVVAVPATVSQHAVGFDFEHTAAAHFHVHFTATATAVHFDTP